MTIRMKSVFVVMVLLAVLPGCGGSSSGDATDDDTTGGSEDSTGTTEDGVSQEDTPSGAGVHSAWGVAWDDFWPDTALTATYVISPLGGGTPMELVATWKENVEWRGGTWLVLAIGGAEPGQDGMAVYIDRSEPWVAKIKGAALFSKDKADGPSMEEWWDEPLVVDFDMAVGETVTADAKQHTTMDGADVALEDMHYELTIEKVDGSVTVAAGEFTDCMVLKGKLSGPFDLEAGIWLHPEQFGLKIDDSPMGAGIELKEAWH